MTTTTTSTKLKRKQASNRKTRASAAVYTSPLDPVRHHSLEGGHGTKVHGTQEHATVQQKPAKYCCVFGRPDALRKPPAASSKMALRCVTSVQSAPNIRATVCTTV